MSRSGFVLYISGKCFLVGKPGGNAGGVGQVSASPHFDKNKQPLEEGIEPDIAINMSESDQLKHKDTLIEKAFEILSE